MDFTIVLILASISGLLFYYLFTKWILVPFYCNLNKKLGYNIYYEESNEPFTADGYSIKGNALNNLISLPLTAIFISLIVAGLSPEKNAFIITFLLIMVVISIFLYPSIGQYFRSDVFTNGKLDDNHSIIYVDDKFLNDEKK